MNTNKKNGFTLIELIMVIADAYNPSKYHTIKSFN